MNLIWLTDIHLDFVNIQTHNKLLKTIVKQSRLNNSNESSVVITGDIGDSSCTIENMLKWKEYFSPFNIKLYFVLGNHDYYNSNIKEYREKITNSNLKYNWLPSAGYVSLTEKTALVGHDGWYDGGYANWFHSKVIIPDYTQIFEMNWIQWWDKQTVFDRMQVLAKEAAQHIYSASKEAIENGNNTIYIATHVPPFRENSVYRDMISDNDWMPHFSSKHMGDMLLKLSSEFKDTRFIVLCGHTHGNAKHIVQSNLVCYTAEARYRQPCISKIFDVVDE